MAAQRYPQRLPRVRSLRFYLLALTAGVMLPVLILAAVEARDAIDARHNEVRSSMRLLLTSGANSVDQGLDSIIAAARLLANSPSLASGDLVAFRREADELANARHVDVVLRDPSGAQLLATRVQPDAPPPTLPPEDTLARPAIQRGDAFVSDIYTSGMTHPFLTRVIVPARLGSAPPADNAYELEVAFASDIVASWLRLSLPHGWFISVLGRNGQIVSHFPDSEEYVGRGTAADTFGPVFDDAGAWQGFDLDGQPLTGVYTKLPTGWSVVVGASDRLLNVPLRTTLFWLTATGVPLILLGLLLSWVLGRRIDRSATALELAAQQLGDGQAIEPVPLPVRDLALVQDALCDASRDLASRRVKEGVLMADLRSANGLLHAVVDGSSDLIFARDEADRILLANEATAQLLGFASGTEAVGYRLEGAGAALAAAPPGRVTAVQNRMFEVSHSALRDAAGRRLGTVSIARDVTERVTADGRLYRLQADLARAGRLSAVAAMGAGLAHELHQPLSAAANFMAVAMRRLNGAAATPDAAKPVADAMAEATAQILRTGEIVKRLRAFIGETEMQEVELAPLIREAAEAAWLQAAPERAQLHFVLDDTLGALIDPVSIQQVVSNLVRNAAEALRGGGDVWIVLERAPDGWSSVSVMDTGPGLDVQAVDRLFDVFAGSGKEGGLGVGLAICRTIVSAHGGWITATNHAGGGAAFIFTLPPRQAALAASGAGLRAA